MKAFAILLCSIVLAHAHSTIQLKVNHQLVTPFAHDLPAAPNLRMPAPVCVDDAAPRLSWQIGTAKEDGLNQSAYQILISTSPDKLEPNKADLWDSSRVNSTQTSSTYTGKSLPSSASGCANSMSPSPRKDSIRPAPPIVSAMAVPFTAPPGQTLASLSPIRSGWPPATPRFSPLIGPPCPASCKPARRMIPS